MYDNFFHILFLMGDYIIHITFYKGKQSAKLSVTDKQMFA